MPSRGLAAERDRAIFIIRVICMLLESKDTEGAGGKGNQCGWEKWFGPAAYILFL